MSPARESIGTKKGASAASATPAPTPTSSTASDPTAAPPGAPPVPGDGAAAGTDFQVKRDSKGSGDVDADVYPEGKSDPDGAARGRAAETDGVSFVSQVGPFLLFLLALPATVRGGAGPRKERLAPLSLSPLPPKVRPVRIQTFNPFRTPRRLRLLARRRARISPTPRRRRGPTTAAPATLPTFTPS